MATKCIRAVVRGRVQGVFFRQSTKQQAQELGLTGHAINLANGDVEVLACGDNAAVDHLLTWLQHGPDLARVDRVDFQDVELSPPLSFTTA